MRGPTDCDIRLGEDCDAAILEIIENMPASARVRDISAVMPPWVVDAAEEARNWSDNCWGILEWVR